MKPVFPGATIQYYRKLIGRFFFSITFFTRLNKKIKKLTHAHQSRERHAHPKRAHTEVKHLCRHPEGPYCRDVAPELGVETPIARVRFRPAVKRERHIVDDRILYRVKYGEVENRIVDAIL